MLNHNSTWPKSHHDPPILAAIKAQITQPRAQNEKG